MFSQKLQINFPLLKKQFIHLNLHNIKETDYPKIKQSYEKHLSAEQYDLASLYAQQMAVCYGLPGLVRYIEAELNVISKAVNQGINTQANGFETLIYLNLAELMLKNENAMNISKQFAPEETILLSEKLSTLKEKLITLSFLKNLQKEAFKTSSQIYARCIEKEDTNLPKKLSLK